MWVIISQVHGRTDETRGLKGYGFTLTQAPDDPDRDKIWLPKPIEFVVDDPTQVAGLMEIVAQFDGTGAVPVVTLSLGAPPEAP